MLKNTKILFILILQSLVFACSSPQKYDLILRNGLIYNASGKEAFKGDIAVNGDTIAAIGNLQNAKGKQEIDLKGLALAPGFVNMLSWATESLIQDGRSLSNIKQGVTLEVMGEGWSMGPLNETMKKEMQEGQEDMKYKIEWSSLGEYLQYLEKKGVSCNVASFIGATTCRIYALGYQNRKPKPEELKQMQRLVKKAMEEGAMGVASALIYAPGFYADTDELVALCKEAAKYDGNYISHMRSEGDRILESINELIRIAKEANIQAEIYHLKIAGKNNWNKYDKVIQKIDSARKAGLKITTDMYTYTAGATGFDASMPPWVQEGGTAKWIERLKNSDTRKKVIEEMKKPAKNWENLYLATGDAGKILLCAFKQDSLKYLIGKTLAEASKIKGKSPEETIIDLVIQDGTRIEVVYFLMSEENVKKQIQIPYMSFGSDALSLAPEGVFLNFSVHPRSYGNFARLLGKYVRDEKLISLSEAIRKLSALPCENLKIKKRGKLEIGYFADLVAFDPAKIQDKATYEKSHQLSEGVLHVWVNGKQVLKNGEHTGTKPGKFVKGPGYKAN